MAIKAKQKRSQLRINSLINSGFEILENENIDEITIANLANYSGLKRTSTYKFFPTADSIKVAMIEVCIDECVMDLDTKIIDEDIKNLSNLLNICVNILYEYFHSKKYAQKLILETTVSPPIDSKLINKLAESIESKISYRINLEEVFNKSGVFRVITQIIISIFSLNTKESGSLNEVGKIEARRASVAYISSFIK